MTGAVTIDTLYRAIEILSRETREFRLGVLQIADRLEAFDDEPERFASLISQSGNARAPKSAAEAMAAIGQAVVIVRDLEYDFNAIRARLDQIANNPKERQRFAREGIRNAGVADAEKAFKDLTGQADPERDFHPWKGQGT